MSTKTLRKRIALVAVAALGAGVLSVAPANAGILLGDIEIAPVTAGTLAAAGVCVVDPKAQNEFRGALSASTVVASGASLTFTSTLDEDATVEISGPAKWSAISTTGDEPAVPDFSINSTATKLTAVAAGSATLTTTGVGSVTVTVKAVGGAGIDVFGITVVASCSSATTFVAANTLVNLAATATAATGTDAITTADKAYNSTVFVNLKLRNAYKGNIADGVVTATATNGALISFGEAKSGITSQAFDAPAGSGDISLAVDQDTTTNPGKALSTVVTIAFNGVTVATKNVTIFGSAASIEVSDVTVGSTEGGTGTFKYVTKDNAGNLVDSPAAAGITNTAAGVLNGDIVSNAVATTNYDPTAVPAAKGEGTFDCVVAGAKSSGSEDMAIGFITTALTVVKSATFKATCGSDVVSTFTASLDKAVYASGEIATLTIAGKDALGGIVSDLAENGILPSTGINLSGLTPIGVVGAADDVYKNGVLTYKFKVDNITSNEQSFVGQVQVTAATDLTPKVLQYKVTAGGSGVSNADVLKSIVALIASINKQIRALQKLILRR